jgi:hypothetical protein
MGPMATHHDPPVPTPGEPRPVRINGWPFLEGYFPCISCDRRFYVLIPEAALYWWSRLCSQCDPTLEFLRQELDAGETVISLEQMPRWTS